jgi:hypothetical protein
MVAAKTVTDAVGDLFTRLDEFSVEHSAPALTGVAP